jgi:hypothetical protein
MRAFRLRRFLLRVVAVLCVLWTVAAPVAARVLYDKPARPEPQGAAKLLFYCHL